MVNTNYLVSTALEIGNAVKASKSNSRQDGEDNFRSMLDKNAQKAEKETPKADTDTQKTEAKEETTVEEPKGEAAAPEAEEGQEALANEELQAVVQQYMMSNEQKLSLNWAEAPMQNGENAQAVTEAVQAAGEQQLTGELKAVQTEQAAVPAQTETAAAQTDALKQNPEAVQTAAQENQPKQEQKAADTTANVEVKAEAKDAQAAVQKGAESQNAGDGQKMDLKEQNTAEAADAAAMQKAAPKEENLVQVKVGETVNLSEPKAAEKLADNVLVKMLENTNEYELQLSPEELGKIKIKLVIEDGKISVAMFCENQKAADLLGLTSARLKGIIEERTGSEAYVEVQKDDTNPYSEQEKEKGDGGRGYEESKKQDKKNDDVMDFMQQLRLGLVDLN